MFRGQEGDPWCVRPGRNGIRQETRPEGCKGEYSESEAENRRRLKTEADYPSVKTLSSAARWLEENHEADRFLLWAEAFDPYEPYDVPSEYLAMYEKDYTGPDVNHPVYKIPADIIDFHNPSQEFSRRSVYNKDTLLFHMGDDYKQEHPISDEKLEAVYIRRLRQCILDHDALPEQPRMSKTGTQWLILDSIVLPYLRKR